MELIGKAVSWNGRQKAYTQSGGSIPVIMEGAEQTGTIVDFNRDNGMAYIIAGDGDCYSVAFDRLKMINGDTDKETYPANNKKIIGAKKASIYVDVICPEYDNIMRNGSDSCHCINLECKSYGDEYLLPQLTIERIGK